MNTEPTAENPDLAPSVPRGARVGDSAVAAISDVRQIRRIRWTHYARAWCSPLLYGRRPAELAGNGASGLPVKRSPEKIGRIWNIP